MWEAKEKMDRGCRGRWWKKMQCRTGWRLIKRKAKAVNSQAVVEPMKESSI